MDFTYQPVERYRAIMALLFGKGLTKFQIPTIRCMFSLRFHCPAVNSTWHENSVIMAKLKVIVENKLWLEWWDQARVVKIVWKEKMLLNPFPDDKILDSSKLKEFADDNFKLDENGRKLFKRVEKWKKVIQTGRKHCGKRRNCSLRAISPFPTVFSKGLFPRGVKRCYCVGMG